MDEHNTCCVHKMHNFTTKSIGEKDFIGHLHAIHSVWSIQSRRNQLLSALTSIVSDELVVHDVCVCMCVHVCRVSCVRMRVMCAHVCHVCACVSCVHVCMCAHVCRVSCVRMRVMCAHVCHVCACVSCVRMCVMCVHASCVRMCACACATSQVAAAIESSIASGFSPNKNACGHVCACVLCDFASCCCY